MAQIRDERFYFSGRGGKEIPDAAFGRRTRFSLLPVSPSFSLFCGFQAPICHAASRSVGAQREVQSERVALVDQVQDASMGQFTRLTPAQFLTVQETGIGSEL